MININSIEDSNDYIEYFKNLKGEEKSELIDFWIEKIQSGEHNNYELLTFFRISRDVGVDTTDNVLETISFLDKSIEEFEQLTDYLLEQYVPGNERQTDLLDNITSKMEECRLLKDFYLSQIGN